MAVDVVIEREKADAWARAIADRIGDAVRVLSFDGARPDDPDISAAEIAVSGWNDHPSVDFDAIVAQMGSLRWIHSVSAGIDHFASPELVERRIVVTNAGGAYAEAMAEHAVGAMIMLAQGFPQMMRSQMARRWEFDRQSLEAVGLGRTLRGKVAGVIGFGRVGRQLAPACRGLGMRVWALRRSVPDLTEDAVERMLGPDRLGELLANSDFVVLCPSLNHSTERLIGAPELETMKASAVLVNIGRGRLVDQPALVDALSERRIAAAALDVTDPEPLPADHKLWTMDNVVITPHVAGDSASSDDQVLGIFLENLRAYLDSGSAQLPDRVEVKDHLFAGT